MRRCSIYQFKKSKISTHTFQAYVLPLLLSLSPLLEHLATHNGTHITLQHCDVIICSNISVLQRMCALQLCTHVHTSCIPAPRKSARCSSGGGDGGYSGNTVPAHSVQEMMMMCVCVWYHCYGRHLRSLRTSQGVTVVSKNVKAVCCIGT